jgi:hypothetical protein
VTTELDVGAYLRGVFGHSVSIVSAMPYNDMLPAAHPETGDLEVLIGAWFVPEPETTETGKKSWYLLRGQDATYEMGQIWVETHPLSGAAYGLRGSRSIRPSPFPEDRSGVWYFCGFDRTGLGGPDVTGPRAWIYKGTLVGGALSVTASAAPSSGGAPLSVAFEAEISGGTPPYAFDWDFGDGSPHSSEADPEHTYAAEGLYPVTLTVTDAAGALASDGHLLVTAVPPPSVAELAKRGNPFRIEVRGSNLQEGIRVLIGGMAWEDVAWKSTGKLVLRGGASLKVQVPSGVPTRFDFVNPDGGQATFTWAWP